jgi:hypothetical protein
VSESESPDVLSKPAKQDSVSMIGISVYRKVVEVRADVQVRGSNKPVVGEVTK